MAKKVWDNEIEFKTDWGGDESTSNLPVSGGRIQEFIKEQFNSKMGEFYYDTTTNRYLVFANPEKRDEYLEDTNKVDLILGAFDAPFNYSAEIKLQTPYYNSILQGTKNNYIDFTFDVLNKQGQSVGENVICTYTFSRGTTKIKKTFQYKYGEFVHFNVDDYIVEGINNINIAIVGATTFAATAINVTYQVIELSLTDSYEVGKSIQIYSDKENILSVPFTVSGAGIKTMEWFLDGELIKYNRIEDEIVEVSSSRTKYINIDSLEHGRHTLQSRAYVKINGEKFYSDILYRDLLITKGVEKDVVIGISASGTAYYVQSAAFGKPYHTLVCYIVLQYLFFCNRIILLIYGILI